MEPPPAARGRRGRGPAYVAISARGPRAAGRRVIARTRRTGSLARGISVCVYARACAHGGGSFLARRPAARMRRAGSGLRAGGAGGGGGGWRSRSLPGPGRREVAAGGRLCCGSEQLRECLLRQQKCRQCIANMRKRSIRRPTHLRHTPREECNPGPGNPG